MTSIYAIMLMRIQFIFSMYVCMFCTKRMIHWRHKCRVGTIWDCQYSYARYFPNLLWRYFLFWLKVGVFLYKICPLLEVTVLNVLNCFSKNLLWNKHFQMQFLPEIIHEIIYFQYFVHWYVSFTVCFGPVCADLSHADVSYWEHLWYYI